MDIIRSAYRTIARRGSHRTSLEVIADDAGVSKALILYHFGNKDALLLAAMQWALQRTQARIYDSVDRSKDARSQIAAVLDAIFVDAEANREFSLFYLDLVEHAARVPSFGSLTAMLDDTINGHFAEMIAAGVEQGAFDVDDVDAAARNMRAIIEGTFLQWIQTGDWRENHAAWRDACRHALLRLLSPPS
jgi:TetR/AcrR family transcriptional regulator, fatty acid metabolism regulator protein